MTPKEKAQELVDKFTFIDNGEKFQLVTTKDKIKAKQCALIAVDEIMALWIQLFHTLKEETIISGKVELSATYIFWQEVKQEIEKL